jgi:hypothetical protein
MIATIAAVTCLLLSSVRAFTCHSDCAPTKCHGPFKRNCNECAANMELVYDSCQCKTGYFDYQGRCDLYLPYCAEMTVVGGVPACTKCDSLRDTLANGACSRDLTKAFFLRLNSVYTGSENNKADANFFYTGYCKSLDATGKCLECPPERVLNTVTKKCDLPLLPSFPNEQPYTRGRCIRFKPDNNCSVPLPFFYLTGINNVNRCSLKCRSCSGPSIHECLSCSDRSTYFEPLPNRETGYCKPCNSYECGSCTGPGPQDCTLPRDTFMYLDQTPGPTQNTVFSCAAGCDVCVNSTYCLQCANMKINMNGVCSSTNNTIANCHYQFNNANGTPKCTKYKDNFLMGTDGLKYAGTGVTLVIPNQRCLTQDLDVPDKLTSQCKTCSSRDQNFFLGAGFCRIYHGTDISQNCQSFASLNENQKVCVNCDSDMYLVINGTGMGQCDLDCSSAPGTVPFYFDQGFRTCVTCYPGCTDCYQDHSKGKLVCTTCAPGSVLVGDDCFFTACGSSTSATFNMHCNYDKTVNPFGTATCSQDCLNLTPGTACASNTSCIRNVFQLTSVAVNKLEFRVTSDMQAYVDFSVATSAIYLPATKQLFCSLIFEKITDETSICKVTYSQPNPGSTSKIEITTSTAVIASLSTQPTTTIKLSSLLISRIMLADPAVYFTVNSVIPVTIDKMHVQQVVAVSSPLAWPASQDYVPEFKMLEQFSSITSVVWKALNYTNDGTFNEGKFDDTNTALLQAPIIPATLLADMIKIQLQVNVTLADQTHHQAEATISFSNLQQNLALIGNTFLDIEASNSLTLLFSYSSSNLDLSLIQVKNDNDILVQGSDYKLSLIPESKKLLLKMRSACSTRCQVRIDYSPDIYLPVIVSLTVRSPVNQISLMTPSIIGSSQPLQFWTNVGSDFQFSVYAFSKITGILLGTSAPQASQYDNFLSTSSLSLSSVNAPEWADFYFVFTKDSQQYTIKRAIYLQSTPTAFEKNIILGTAYRDGSTLQSSLSKLSIGTFKFGRIADPFPSPIVNTVQFVDSLGELKSTESSLVSTNLKNKVELSPDLTSASGKWPLLDSFSYQYTANDSSVYSWSNLIRIYNSPTFSSQATHLDQVDQSKAVFEVIVSSSAGYNKWVTQDTTQYLPQVRLPVINALVYPIILAGVDRCFLLKLDLFPFQALDPALSPKLQVSIFDYQAFSSYADVPLILKPGWVPAQLPVSSYITTLNSSLAAATGTELLRQLNLAVYTCNQAYLSCKTNGSCLASDLPIRNMREMLWNQFTTYWNTVADKDAWQDWTTSVLKSSFIGALTLTGDNITDAVMTQIDAELFRETNSILSKVSTAITGLSRIAYKVGENLKAVLPVTLQNIELNINAYTHDLRLFGYFFKSQTNITSYQAKLDEIYLKVVSLNEIKLLRYTMPSDKTVFENELVLLGGATLLSPLDAEYNISFSDILAVQLKNLQFNSTLVSSYNLRNPTRCLSC